MSNFKTLTECMRVMKKSSNLKESDGDSSPEPKVKFTGDKSLKSFTIPDGVTSIDNEAFKGCSSLTSIKIPDSVTSIGDSAFADCSSLTSIKIPDRVTEINKGAFWFCSNLTSVTIGNAVEYIGNFAFEGCSKLTSIKIPDSVTGIGFDAFRNCSGLTSITIGNAVEFIENYAFKGCKGLKTVNLKARFNKRRRQDIGYGIFENCTSLTSIAMPEGWDDISVDMFRGCTSLTSVKIFKGVRSIFNRAFAGCTSLKEIVLPDGLENIFEEVFAGCTSLTSVIIPDSVTYIDEDTFYGCTSLDEKTKKRINEIRSKMKNSSNAKMNESDVNGNIKGSTVDKYLSYIPKAYKGSSAEKLALARELAYRAIMGAVLPEPYGKKYADPCHYDKFNKLTDDEKMDVISKINLTEPTTESVMTEASMSRSEMIDFIDEIYNTRDGEKFVDGAIRELGIDPNTLDDSDPNEGFYSNFSNDELNSIVASLKGGRDAGQVPITDSELENRITSALSTLGRVEKLQGSYSGALASYDIRVGNRSVRVQVYSND